jgi:hypothetical protein
MTYKPHADFVALYDLYTGPRSVAAELAIRKGEATANDPLLISTGSDLVLFPGGGRPPVVESFRHSTRGFKELTAFRILAPPWPGWWRCRKQGLRTGAAGPSALAYLPEALGLRRGNALVS